jgi:hypothetical protein
MSPADIAQSAEFRAGLARRLAELGLIAPEQADLRVAPPAEPPSTAADEQRKAA